MPCCFTSSLPELNSEPAPLSPLLSWHLNPRRIVIAENGKNYAEAYASCAKGVETIEWACSMPQIGKSLFRLERGLLSPNQPKLTLTRLSVGAVRACARARACVYLCV